MYLIGLINQRRVIVLIFADKVIKLLINMGVKENLKRRSTEIEISKKKRKIRRNENSITNNVRKKSKIENIEDCSVSYDVKNYETSKFSSLQDKISQNTLRAIENMGFKTMEKIVERCILKILQGENLVTTIKTKSTSNLSFLIPAIELINKLSSKLQKGTGCIIVTSTRESALQVFGTLKELLQFYQFTSCLLIDGSDQKTESRKLSKGVNFIVATASRLFHHLQNTPDFVYKNLQILIFDETDRILQTGNEETLKQIIPFLPEKRQTAIFMKEKINIEKFELSINKKPIVLNQVEREEKIVDGLEEGYIIAPSDKRFHFLLNFLEKNKKKKIIVLFSSCLSTIHHHDLFTSLDVPVSSIHGKQKQVKRREIFSKFSSASSGILLCAEATTTEVVFPKVDWILQYDPPENPKEHINRLSEMSKESKGKAVLILSPEEIGFLSYLKEVGVSTSEFKISWNKIKNVQVSLEKLMAENYFLNLSGKEAFKAFVKSYDSHHLKKIFNIERLDLTKVAKSFGFTVPPAVDLSINKQEFDKSARPEKRLGGGGYGFFKTMNRMGEKKGQNKIFKQVGKRKKLSKSAS
ncbi:probable ATP-dependent RNA helicase pitchoune isoform X2 [Leptopilina heterotoma]|uniref:probable ATP-dependent RNA helicase pitchoune isoform X2 n=1 Tax=Leptopilina heterotoma TaxID=63436 RepID=UPI001CA7BB07|nr:probable ATP-dependent RNA helicase pitchoune isoform X2 [Leptopilina heterotoma]